jgi:hypothetical protein
MQFLHSPSLPLQLRNRSSSLYRAQEPVALPKTKGRKMRTIETATAGFIALTVQVLLVATVML